MSDGYNTFVNKLFELSPPGVEVSCGYSLTESFVNIKFYDYLHDHEWLITLDDLVILQIDDEQRLESLARTIIKSYERAANGS